MGHKVPYNVKTVHLLWNVPLHLMFDATSWKEISLLEAVYLACKLGSIYDFK